MKMTMQFERDLGARRQRGDRVDDEHIDGAGADERVGDLERLLAGVRLRDQEVVEIDAELAGIDRVERVLGIDEGTDAALLLGFGDGVQSERGLAGGLRPVDFDDAALGQAADAERDVETQRTGRNRLDLDRLLVLAQAHDRALAERPFDLRERRVERLGLVHRRAFHELEIRLIHDVRSLWQGREDISIAPISNYGHCLFSCASSFFVLGGLCRQAPAMPDFGRRQACSGARCDTRGRRGLASRPRSPVQDASCRSLRGGALVARGGAEKIILLQGLIR
jgi:hypothetical protein